MKKSKKNLIIILSCILLVIAWHYFKNPITIKEERAFNIPLKFSLDLNNEWQKVVNVYIPYKIEIQNNRLKEFRLSSFSDGNHGNGDNLLYNTTGLELNDYYSNDYSEFFTIQEVKYRESIFPFFIRTFYYYKRHQFLEGKLKGDFNLLKIDYNEYRDQLELLSNNLKFPIEKRIIDSLYKSDDNKRFNIYFNDNRNLGTIMFLETRFNSHEQVFIDVNDSIQGMNREQMENYKTNLIKRTTL